MTLTILIAFILVGFVSAQIDEQQNEVTYNFYVEQCNQEGKIEVSAGSMIEGGSFTIEFYELPNAEATTQFFYDLIVGSEIGLQENSLNEDIHIDITLVGLCDIDPTNLPSKKELKNLIYFEIDVTGAISGKQLSGVYQLERGKHFYFKLLMKKIGPFLTYVNYSVDDLFPFFLDENDNLNYNGITKVVDDESINIYAENISTMGIGIGQDEEVTSINDNELVSNEFNLDQNYPNPFNPSTKISYNLQNAGLTKLTIYNAIGEEVQSLFNETQQAGFHSVSFNASNLPSGMYFYTLTSGNFTQTNKMILMK